MKMDPADFLGLKNAFYRVVGKAREINPTAYGALTLRDAWNVYFRIMKEWSYPDDLRAQLEAVTGIPCVEPARPGYTMHHHYDCGLSDAHIETALRKILAA